MSNKKAIRRIQYILDVPDRLVQQNIAVNNNAEK